ncbi:MAG: undecaprenyl/decaprenyl-phosphate alpha-N-acetylglucosaminyl 1-phosphate transferase, partial [Desulfarculus sp.]|nr:undecaprenyl/decaprenyl-phosphate alpha-N-acetylglucosaminyl 1-phosphate transferase [Desulfarculus sp.]
MLSLEPSTLIGLSLLASMLLCLVLVPGCMALARRLGAVDYPRHNLDNPKAVPRLGGLAIFASSLLVLAAASYLVPTGKQTLATLGPKLWGFALGAVMVLVLGLVDDIRGLRARWKLLGEIIIALFVYFWGLRVEVITNPFNPASPLHLGSLEMPLNVLWMVLAMNAMNLIDGMDGLAGGVFLLALVLLLAAGLMGGHYGLSLLTATLLGATAAFLRYNFFAGSIYLGDSGSLLMGYCLSAFVPLFSPKAAGLAAAVIPVAVLSVPIAEVLVTAVRRVWKGQPLGHPDQGHAHHRMLASGMNQRLVTLVIQLLSFFCGLTALIMTYFFNQPLALLLGALWLALLGLFVKVGYFRQRNGNGKAALSRVNIFLDMDRVLHRKVFMLKQAGSLAEVESSLAELARALGLAGLRFAV